MHMEKDNIQVLDYIDVDKKAKELGCIVPTKLCILPRNFPSATSKEELLHEENTATVTKVLKQDGIKFSPLENENEKFSKISEHDSIWAGPTLYFAATWCLQNPDIILQTISIITGFLKDSLKGLSGGVVKLSVVTKTKTGKFREVKYKGPVEGLKDVPDIVKSTFEDNES